MEYLDYLNKTIHETDRWTVISDSKGDVFVVETTRDTVWNQLAELHKSKEERWIDGIAEEFTTKWGFRFKPDTIVIVTVTIKGAQSTIRGISEDLGYWMNVWGNVAYIWTRVSEIHR